MAVSAAYISKLSLTQSPSLTPALDSSNQTYGENAVDTTHTLTAGTTPPVSQAAVARVTLSGGAATIDLRALVDHAGITLDNNGLKLRHWKLKAPANANVIYAKKGASNGYDWDGGVNVAASQILIQPSGEAMLYFATGSPAIDATHKTIDFVGTGAQYVDIEMTFGA